MTWIESHQSLRDHPKTKRLARALDVPKAQAVGMLHFLWYWALDYADDGCLGRVTDQEIAEACEWTGEPEAFVAALREAGFIDADRTVHDWDDYAGKLIDQRRANADRQKRHRDKKKAERAGLSADSNGNVTVMRNERNVTHNGAVTVTLPLRNAATVPDSTGPNPTRQNQRASRAETSRARADGRDVDTIADVIVRADASEDWDGQREAFEGFRRAYPKPVPEELWALFRDVVPQPEVFDELIVGLARWAGTSQWREEPARYSTNPKTWLGDTYWRKDPSTGKKVTHERTRSSDNAAAAAAWTPGVTLGINPGPAVDDRADRRPRRDPLHSDPPGPRGEFQPAISAHGDNIRRLHDRRS